MLKFLRNFLVIFLVLFVLVWFLPNFSLGYPTGANFDWYRFVNASPVILISSLVLTILTTLIRPLLKVLLMPINFLTLGLANFVINFALIWFVTFLVPGFDINPLVVVGVNLGTVGGLAVVSILFSFLQSALILLF